MGGNDDEIMVLMTMIVSMMMRMMIAKITLATEESVVHCFTVYSLCYALTVVQQAYSYCNRTMRALGTLQ